MFVEYGALSMTYGTRSHPTQLFHTVDRLATIHTSNGFCFCDNFKDCQTHLWSPHSNCTLNSTIFSLYDQKWRRSHEIVRDKRCREQLDWPWEGGTMRDGMTTGARNQETECNVMERLPPFLYRYSPNGTITPIASTSLDEGGVCHMGPAPVLPADLNREKIYTTRCRTIGKNVSFVTLRCDNMLQPGFTEDLYLPRERSQTPAWMVDHMKTMRQRCNTCSALPKWKQENDRITNPNDMPAGAEVSFGIPFRWSASRLLAAEVREILCGLRHSSHYENCTALQELDHWQQSSFLKFFAGTDAAQLFTGGGGFGAVPPSVLQHTLANAPVDENLLWDGPDAGWVACNTDNNTCLGTISKDDWYDASKRGEVCKNEYTRVVREGGVEEKAFGTNVCDLTADLGRLCETLQVARRQVFLGNCIYARACDPQEFVYSPGIFSVTNENFVRQTVTEFYERYNQIEGDPDIIEFFGVVEANRVCPADQDDVDLINRNAALLQNCASKQLDRFQDALRIMRRAVHLVFEIIFIMINLFLSFVRLIVPQTEMVSGILNEIEFWFMRLILIIWDSIEEIGNLLFRVIFDSGGLGTQIKNIIRGLCHFRNWVLRVWDEAACWTLREVVAPLLYGIGDGLKKLDQLQVMGSFPTDMINLSNDMYNFKCDSEVPCEEDTEERIPTVEDATLPVATRCWADYVPDIDDWNALSCSASDTCRVSSFNVGVTATDAGGLVDDERQILCDSCEYDQGSASNINRFGCDIYTKQCTCNHLRQDKTFCTTNEQCQIQGDDPSICALVGDFSTGQSYGSTLCETCPVRPVCHITDGATGVGRCSCMQQQTPLMSCNNVGLSMPDPSQMCAVNLDLGTRNFMATVYQWELLATAPCATVSPSTAYCYTVPGYGKLVVGHTLAGGFQLSGRRLLEAPRRFLWPLVGNTTPPAAAAAPGDTLLSSIKSFESWTSVGEPCRSLVAQHLRDPALGGVSDRRALEGCVHWRRVGRDAIGIFNLTLVGDEGDSFLLSMEDFARVVSAKGVLRSLLRWDLVGYLVRAFPSFAAAEDIVRAVLHHVGALRLERLVNIHNVSRFEDLAKHNNLTEEERAFVSNLQYQYNLTQAWLPFMMMASATVVGPPNASATAVGPPNASAKNTTTTATASPMGGRRRGRGRRKLLAQPADDPITVYSALTATIQGFSDIPLDDTLAETWLEGPFGWPPRFTYFAQNDSCVALTSLRDAMVDTVGVLKKYYVDDFALRFQQPSWSIQKSLPKFYDGTPASNETSSFRLERERRQAAGGSGTDWVVLFYEFVGETLLEDGLGITPESIANFFTTGKGVSRDQLTAGNLARDFLVCDYEAAQLCSRRERNVVISLLIVYVAYVVISAVLGFFKLSGLATLLFALIPILAIYLAYGLGPTCFPMIPTCLAQDIISIIQVIIPAKVAWPTALQVYEGCLGPSWIQTEEAIRLGQTLNATTPDPRFPDIPPGSSKCFLSCRQDPFSFVSWEQTAAWIVCGMGPETCANLSIPYFDSFRESTHRFAEIHENIRRAAGNTTKTRIAEDVLHAYSFCFWITLAQALPYFFALIFFVYLAFSALQVPLTLISTGTTCLMQALAFSHAVEQ